MDIEENLVSLFARKRLCIKTNRPDNILEKFKITHRGKVYLACAKELFAWTPIFLDCKVPEYISDDDVLHSASNNSVGGRTTIYGSFGLHDLLKKHPKGAVNESDPSLSHPLGFTLEASRQVDDPIGEGIDTGFIKESSPSVHSKVMNNSDEVHVKEVSKGNSEFRHSHNHKCGLILEVLDDMVWVGQSMGYEMDGLGHKTKKELVKELNLQHKVNFLMLQETKMDRITHMDVKLIWGNSNYQFVSSDSVGDFNDVRSIEERLGSVFDHSSARAFNHFIEASGLVDVKLEGYSFTWSHPSASKMNKLDQFLVSKVFTDFGPTPFRLYHSWFKRDGFDAMVEHAWNSFSHSDSNRGIVSDELLLKKMDFTQQLLEIKQMEAKDWTDPEVVKVAFKDHFANRFNQPGQGAVWNNVVNKSPGPDGFTFEFFRRYWSFIGPDFCSAIDCFFESGNFPMGSNASFIALIPEVTDAKYVTGFKPISLIRCIYKVVMKILANRLAMVITDLVSDTQSAFVSNKQILDGPFILNELIAWCKRKKKQSMIFKVDFAKAYDSVRWDYLLDVLHAFGFGPNWCKWIREPLVQVFSMGFGSTMIYHLFYADDAIFMGEWSDFNMANIVKILRSDCMARKSAWFDIVHKSHHRLSKWKVKTLSIGGRLTLLKSVLGATPLYNMSIYKVPIGFNFISHCKKQIGDGRTTRFWYDPWVSVQPLHVMFPHIFAFGTDKDSMVGSKLGPLSVDVSFRRPVRDGAERQQWSELCEILEPVMLSSSKDRWTCDLNGDGKFHVKEVRSLLDNIFLPSANVPTRWVKFISIKINIFAWRAA
nr:RNA-directed DNA polymerase, eukaryota, reverse transcriptase zinc-binding domain protein [Tanacetum cinerariifolium]